MVSVGAFIFQVVSFLKLYIIAIWAVLVQLVVKHRSVKHIPNMEGIVAIVTGGSSGLGLEAAKCLAQSGMHIILACKNDIEAKTALDEIFAKEKNAKVESMIMDLSSLNSVRSFAKKFRAKGLPLHMLINNAGVMIPEYTMTADGFELQMAVNYLAHFLLTQLLLDILEKTGTPQKPAKVINVASIAHEIGALNLDDLQSRKVYSAHAAYCQSKLAVVMSSYELQRRLAEKGSHVTVASLHPGIVNTPLYRHINSFIQSAKRLLGTLLMKSPRQGADTILYLAFSEDSKCPGGYYYDNCKKAKSCSVSYDRHLQEVLWHKSCHLVGVPS